MYLFRHGAVDYVNPDGSWVPDPDAVSLNERGREQARGMQAFFSGTKVDRALCSGLARTRQTAEMVLADHEISIFDIPQLEEIRPTKNGEEQGFDLYSEIAFSHWRAAHPNAQFLGGEKYQDFYERISAAAETIIADHSWHNIAVFAHGGTNAAVLGWVTGLGLDAFGLFDQETCCLNIIDFDTTETGVVRKTLRGVNITSTDPLKSSRHAGDMELLAKRLSMLRG